MVCIIDFSLQRVLTCTITPNAAVSMLELSLSVLFLHDQCESVNFVPLMQLLERSDLFQLVSLAADLGFLPVDDLPVLAQLVFPAWTLVL